MQNTRYLAPPPGDTKLSELFYGKLKTSGKKCYDLEAATGLSGATIRKILRHPERVSMDKMKYLAKKIGVSKSEFCQALEW